MWISKAEHERLTTDNRGHASEMGRRHELEIRVAQLTAHVDWLTAQVNTLSHERAALTDKLLSVTYPVPIIERRNEVPARPLPGIVGRPVEDGLPVPLSPVMPGARTDHMPAFAAPAARPWHAEDAYEGSIPALQAGQTIFEDVGDAAARELGLNHDEFGNLTNG